MGQEDRHWMNEADIGSGEKGPGQEDVEKDERAVPATAGDSAQAGNGSASEGRILQSGTHLARILAVPQNNGTYEAQVYVRLAREPEIAETYIPVGTYPNEIDAWRAAEDRARRAFQEHEF